MLEVQINIIPFGEDSQKETIRTFFIAQEEKFHDDFRGYGVYLKDPREGNKKVAMVVHARNEGAVKLVSLAIQKLVIED